MEQETLLERLKELNGQGRGRRDGEDLGHWADRNKEENLWVRDIALPLLLELAEAVRVYADNDGEEEARHYAEMLAVLAKLEAPHD